MIMKEFFRKNKSLLLIIVLIIIIVCIVFMVLKIKENKICYLTKSSYEMQYDNTWNVIKENEEEAELVHKKSRSKLNIKISKMNEEEQYRELDEIFDSLLYNIQKQNEAYKLIYKEKTKITKNDIDGYKLLFETNNTESEIYFYKQGDKLVTFTYEAEYEFFDILLDSVNNIIYNFSINEQKFDVKSSINLNLDKINYTKQNEISNLLKNTKDDEIANNNFLVNYSIPDNFEKTSYNTKYEMYSFRGLTDGNNITLTTNIKPCNLYEYLDKDDTVSIYSKYNQSFYNIQDERLDKFRDEPLSYIYQNNYNEYNKEKENISLIFELNQSHIFTIDISSDGEKIPQELVDMIKINKIQNIASYIKIEKEGENLIGKLKRFTDYSYEKTEEITLRIPENYQEVDKGENLYAKRCYEANYNQEKQFFGQELQYYTTNLNIEQELESLDTFVNKNYGEYKEPEKKEDIQINDKIFKVYEMGYTQLSNAKDEDNNRYKYYTKEKILFYELQNKGYLVIIIKDNNGNDINNELITKLTNFDINIK